MELKGNKIISFPIQTQIMIEKEIEKNKVLKKNNGKRWLVIAEEQCLFEKMLLVETLNQSYMTQKIPIFIEASDSFATSELFYTRLEELLRFLKKNSNYQENGVAPMILLLQDMVSLGIVKIIPSILSTTDSEIAKEELCYMKLLRSLAKENHIPIEIETLSILENDKNGLFQLRNELLFRKKEKEKEKNESKNILYRSRLFHN